MTISMYVNLNDMHCMFHDVIFRFNLLIYILRLQLHMRYQIEDLSSRSMVCNVQVYLGIGWLKSTKHKKRFTKNIISNMQERLTVMFSVVEKEYASGK